jgi:hypothetical protein
MGLPPVHRNMLTGAGCNQAGSLALCAITDLTKHDIAPGKATCAIPATRSVQQLIRPCDFERTVRHHARGACALPFTRSCNNTVAGHERLIGITFLQVVLNVAMACSGCSGAVERVLKKLPGACMHTNMHQWYVQQQHPFTPHSLLLLPLQAWSRMTSAWSSKKLWSEEMSHRRQCWKPSATQARRRSWHKRAGAAAKQVPHGAMLGQCHAGMPPGEVHARAYRCHVTVQQLGWQLAPAQEQQKPFQEQQRHKAKQLYSKSMTKCSAPPLLNSVATLLLWQ